VINIDRGLNREGGTTMKIMRCAAGGSFLRRLSRILLALFVVSAISLVSFPAQAKNGKNNPCAKTSRAARKACDDAVRETY
jgi:preprotein translocase subunit SecG